LLQQNFWLQQQKFLSVVPDFVAVTKPFIPCCLKILKEDNCGNNHVFILSCFPANLFFFLKKKFKNKLFFIFLFYEIFMLIKYLRSAGNRLLRKIG